MVERSKVHPNIQVASKSDNFLPAGWPKDVPLPTLEEAEEAVRKVGVILVQFKQENKEKLLGPNDEPPTNDLERITVTI